MRFTLRRMFAITAGCAVAIAILLWATENYRRQRVIRADLMKQGAAWVGFSNSEPDCQPNLMFNQPITYDFHDYERLNYVELKGYNVGDSCLKQLSKLRQIDGLYFISCSLDCDLDNLHTIMVPQLIFWSVNIGDESLDSISRIPGLKKVVFMTTKVSPQGVERLKTDRPDIEVILRP